MPSTAGALLLASTWLSATVSGSPIEAPRIGFAYSLPMTVSPASKFVKPISAMAAPYKKFNAVMPPVLKAAVSKKAAANTGTTATTPTPFDVQYLVPVQIQGKTFDLIVDSGSSDLWVFSDQLPAKYQENRSVYKTTSATIKSGQTFSVNYGDGSYARGKVYADKVTIGGVTVTSQAVEAATDIAQSFANSIDSDGLLGLSFSSLNAVRPTQQLTFFDNARASLAQPIYAVTLKKQAVGSLDFGYINQTKYIGNLNYAPVTPSSDPFFWQLTIRRYAINGTDYVSPVGAFNAIVDTGTSLTYLPQAIVKDYYRRIPGSGIDHLFGMYAFPCSASIPPMGVWIAGVKYPIRPELINWEQLNATHCLGGIQSSENLPFSILGATWLKTVYAVFDAGNANRAPRMGFAKQNPRA